jgi:hypothetical protein
VPVYDEVTGLYACVCAEGHICTTADSPSASGGLSTNQVLAIVDTVLVGVLILAGVIGIGFILFARSIQALEKLRPLTPDS